MTLKGSRERRFFDSTYLSRRIHITIERHHNITSLNHESTHHDRTIHPQQSTHQCRFRRDSQAIILSVNTITEGIDIRCTDLVALVDSTQSTIRIVQCVGRAMRTFDYIFDSPVDVVSKTFDVESLPQSCQYDGTLLNCGHKNKRFVIKVKNSRIMR